MARNVEIAQCAIMRVKARSLTGRIILSNDERIALNNAINAVKMPLYDYYRKSDEEVRNAFINAVIGGLGATFTLRNKEKIEQCLKINL